MSGAGLSTNWTANECLTWTRSDYDTSGRVVVTLASNEQWRRFDNANLADGGLKITEMLPTASLPNNGFASTLSQFLSSGRVNVSATTLVPWSDGSSSAKRIAPLYRKSMWTGTITSYTAFNYQGLVGDCVEWSAHEFLKPNSNTLDLNPQSEPQLVTTYRNLPDNYTGGLGTKLASRNQQIVNPDGAITTFAFDSSGLIAGWMRTVQKRDPVSALPLAAPATGTHLWTETIEDSSGRVQRESTIVATKNGSGPATQVEVATSSDFLEFRDSQGRRVREEWRDGTRAFTSLATINQVTGGLLASRSMTDFWLRQTTATDVSGTETIVTRNRLDRPILSRRSAAAGLPQLDTTFSYAYRTGGGRLDTQKRDNLRLTKVVQFDTASRRVSTKDEADLTTTYSYTTGTGGTSSVTATLLSTATEITTEGPEGKTVSATGTARVAQVFSEGLVNAASDTSPPQFSLATYDNYIRLTTQTGSGRVRHEILDGAGRMVACYGSADEAEYIYVDSGFPKNTAGTSLSASTTVWRRLSTLPGTALVAETRTLSPDGLLNRARTFVDTALHEQCEETSQPQSNANINTAGPCSNVAKTIWHNGLKISESSLTVTQPTVYSYDAHGRVEGIRDPLTRRLTEYRYNAQGQVATVIDNAGNQTVNAYYAQG